MKRIIIIDDNFYNRIGIYSLLKEKIIGVECLDSVTSDNIAKASLIICSFSLLKKVSSFINYKTHPIKIICIFDKLGVVNFKGLPICMSNIILVPNNIKALQLCKLVVNCLNYVNEKPSFDKKNICNICVENYFSPQQFNILTSIFNGLSVHDIAIELMISKSTVYSHIHYIMKRYNLRTKHQLYLFWRLANERLCDNTPPKK